MCRAVGLRRGDLLVLLAVIAFKESFRLRAGLRECSNIEWRNADDDQRLGETEGTRVLVARTMYVPAMVPAVKRPV